MTDGMTFRLIGTVREPAGMIQLPGGTHSWWQMEVDVRQRGKWDAARRAYGPDEVFQLTLRLADEAAIAHAKAAQPGDRVLVLGHVQMRRWTSKQGRESVFQDWVLDALTLIDGRRKPHGAAAPATPAARESVQTPGQGGSLPFEDDEDFPF